MACDLQPEIEFTIVAAATQREQWLAWLTETAGADFVAWPQVHMDLSAVESFDSAAVQLLLSLSASLARRGQQLVLVAPTACVLDALGRFGLEGHFAITALAAPAPGPEAGAEADAGSPSGPLPANAPAAP